jgi:hypothetical protein
MAAKHGYAGIIHQGGTATGNSTDYLDLPYPSTRAGATVINAATTSATMTLQGSIAGSDEWFNISAAQAINTTGAATHFVSTASAVFDNVRVNISANAASASSKAFTIWVTAAQ